MSESLENKIDSIQEKLREYDENRIPLARTRRELMKEYYKEGNSVEAVVLRFKSSKRYVEVVLGLEPITDLITEENVTIRPVFGI